MNQAGKRRSDKLNPQEVKAFRKWLADKLTKYEAVDELGITLPTLDRVRALNRGSVDTIAAIRRVINQQPA